MVEDQLDSTINIDFNNAKDDIIKLIHPIRGIDGDEQVNIVGVIVDWSTQQPVTPDPLRAAAYRWADTPSNNPDIHEVEEALLVAVINDRASQPVTRGQEADEAWEALLAEAYIFDADAATQEAFRNIITEHRPIIEAALRGQVNNER